MRKRILAVALLSFAIPVLAQDAVEKARLSRKFLSAFRCATFAELSGDKKEQVRLEDLGIKAGRDFIEAVKNNQIPQEIAMSEVPISVLNYLKGPSADFILGRIFENSINKAFEDVPKASDDNVRKIFAQSKYLDENCVFVK